MACPYSTCSTYSKGPGDCEGSAAWCLPGIASRSLLPSPRQGRKSDFGIDRGRISDFGLSARSDFRLWYFAQKPSPGQRRMSASALLLAIPLTKCFLPLTRPAVNPGLGTGLVLSILLSTGLLQPFLCWQQDCPGALRAAWAWNCSCPSTGL